MIIVTEMAKWRVHAIAKAALPEGYALRLEIDRSSGTEGRDRVVMSVEAPEEGDEAIEQEGEPLMYVSRKVSAAYDGCLVDLEHTERGIAFSIGPPLAGLGARS